MDAVQWKLNVIFVAGVTVGDLERATSKKNPAAIDGFEGNHREKTSRSPTKNCLT